MHLGRREAMQIHCTKVVERDSGQTRHLCLRQGAQLISRPGADVGGRQAADLARGQGRDLAGREAAGLARRQQSNLGEGHAAHGLDSESGDLGGAERLEIGRIQCIELSGAKRSRLRRSQGADIRRRQVRNYGCRKTGNLGGRQIGNDRGHKWHSARQGSFAKSSKCTSRRVCVMTTFAFGPGRTQHTRACLTNQYAWSETRRSLSSLLVVDTVEPCQVSARSFGPNVAEELPDQRGAVHLPHQRE